MWIGVAQGLLECLHMPASNIILNWALAAASLSGDKRLVRSETEGP